MADLSTNLQTAFAAVGADVKKLLAQDGNLSQLTTKQKASLVVAINELDAAIKAIDVKSVIDDMASDTTHVWSAQKVGSEISSACQGVKDALLGGAGEAYDTLQELATLIDTNKDAIAALQEIAAGHVRFDKKQELSTEQQKQARDNIDVPSNAELSAVSGVANEAKNAAETNAGNITALQGTVGEVSKVANGAKEAAANNATAIGTLGSLKTTAKNDVVSAVNEVKGTADTGVANAATAQAAAEKAQKEVDALELAVGDTSADFAASYTAARDAL